MKYCEYCLNHGLNFYVSARHQNDCPFSDCQCQKCCEIVIEDMNGSVVTKTSPKLLKAVDNYINDNSNTKTNSETNDGIEDPIPTQSIQMEPIVGIENGSNVLPIGSLKAVRGLAEKLSSIAVSDNDLRTCVLYALLQKNEMSVEKTKRQLCSTRAAITESLILSAFHTNDNSRHKRSISSLETNDSTEVSSDGTQESESIAIVYKAKKSFGKPTANKTIISLLEKPLSVRTADISVQTIEQNPENSDLNPSRSSKMTTSPLIISPKILVSTQTQTQSPIVSMKCLPTVPQLRKTIDLSPKPLCKPNVISNVVPTVMSTVMSNVLPNIAPIAPNMITTATLVNPNLQTIMLMPLVNNSVNPNINRFQIQIPTNSVPTRTGYGIRSVRPVRQQIVFSPNASNTKSISMNSGSITSCRPLSPKAPQSIRLSTLLRPPISAYSTQYSNFCNNLPKTGAKRLKTHNLVNITTNSIQTNCINNVSKNLSPEMKTYSKLDLKESPNPTDTQSTVNSSDYKFCAKIITSEAALAALSAISDSNDSSFDNSKRNYDFEDIDNEEYILPDEDSNQLDDTDRVQPLIQSNQTKDLKTSNSFQPLTNNSKQLLPQIRLNSANESISRSNDSNEDEDIVQITID